MSDILVRITDAVGQNIGRIFAFLCSGFAFFFLLFIDDRVDLVAFVHDTGIAVSVVSAILIGVVIFNVYYKFLGELFIFPFQHKLHYLLDRRIGWTGENSTSPIYLLMYYGVKRSRAREAYGL